MRTASISRKTKETDIQISINLDGNGTPAIETGIGFFNHMLTALSVHSGIDMEVNTMGDLIVDGHHSVEDTGIVLGKAFAKAIGDCVGIKRYGNAFIPMDEALAAVSLDVSGRPYLVFNAEFSDDKIGDYDTCLTEEFFRAFAFNAGITLHINLMYGKNDHHKTEAIFKSVAHALKEAVSQSESQSVLSTKGVL